MDTSQMTCPKCGWARDLGANECPACGIVYARYGGPPRQASPPGAGLAEPPPLPPVNPYAPPQSSLQNPAPAGQMYGMFSGAGGGVWRTGDLLVMQKGATLPNRCLVCNQPASVQLPKKMYWHHPGIYFLLLFNLLIYAIVAMIARKSADVVLPLCTEHAEKRKKATTTATILTVLGFVGMAGSCTQVDNGGAFGLILGLGILVLLAGLIVFAVAANLIVPKKIDDSYVWLKKVGAAYLDTLPTAPLGL